MSMMKIVMQIGKDAIVVDFKVTVPFMADSESGASKLATGAVGGVSKVVASPYLRISQPVGQTNVGYSSMDGALNTPLKGDVVIKGVFEDKKFKSSASAQQNTSYNMGHFTKVVSENVSNSNIQVAECDPDKYIKGVTEAINYFMEESTQFFINNGKK